MKKSTLISTLAMVVIVALALTTATFAWYTANDSVTAKSTVTAAATGSANIIITDGSDSNKSGVAITLTDVGEELLPMAPKTDWSAEPAEGEDPISFTDAKLDTYTANKADGKFTANGTQSTAYLASSFTVTNKSPNTAVATLKISLTDIAIENEAEDDTRSNIPALRVAIFQDGEFKGVLASTASTVTCGEIVKGEMLNPAADTNPDAFSTGAVTEITNLDVTSLADYDGVTTISFIAWFDGSVLDDAGQGAGVTFTFKVVGTVASTPAP